MVIKTVHPYLLIKGGCDVNYDNYIEIKRFLNDLAYSNGFVSKGDAHFRVIGDGIFQVLKLEKEKRKIGFGIYLALHSMYSFLDPRWFKANSCLTKYPLIQISGSQCSLSVCNNNEKNIERLQKFVTNDLNTVLHQEDLIALMSKLENEQFGHIIWNDLQKYAPFLYIGDYCNAEKVVRSIINQHANAYRVRMIKRDLMNDEDILTEFEIREELVLRKLLALARDKDESTIRSFLSSNLSQNLKYATFCQKRITD